MDCKPTQTMSVREYEPPMVLTSRKARIESVAAAIYDWDRPDLTIVSRAAALVDAVDAFIEKEAVEARNVATNV